MCADSWGQSFLVSTDTAGVMLLDGEVILIYISPCPLKQSQLSISIQYCTQHNAKPNSKHDDDINYLCFRPWSSFVQHWWVANNQSSAFVLREFHPRFFRFYLYFNSMLFVAFQRRRLCLQCRYLTKLWWWSRCMFSSLRTYLSPELTKVGLHHNTSTMLTWDCFPW